jgi:hypothetical protein
MNTNTGAAPEYSLYALINRFDGAVDAEALFRRLAQEGKVRFAMNVQPYLYVSIDQPPPEFVVQIISVADLEKDDGVAVMEVEEVSTALAFIFSDEARTRTVLSETGQIHILCSDGEHDFTMVIFWNTMRRAWEIQKFTGDHNRMRMQKSDFLLSRSVRGGPKLAIAA